MSIKFGALEVTFRNGVISFCCYQWPAKIRMGFQTKYFEFPAVDVKRGEALYSEVCQKRVECENTEKQKNEKYCHSSLDFVFLCLISIINNTLTVMYIYIHTYI